MIGQFDIDDQLIRVDFTRGVCIAIPLDFAGRQPSHFGAVPARAVPMKAGGFIGDTHQGGSCNVPCLTINPHCNGTHTESVAHIVNDSVAIHHNLPGVPIPATLLTITPLPIVSTGESYRPPLTPTDMLITAQALQATLPNQPDAWLEAIVIRTSPNSHNKLHCEYGLDCTPPFLTIEAIDYLSSRGVKHLLIDTPSVDKMHDEGLLTVHHRFWNVPEGTHNLTSHSRLDRTITELIYVPDTVPDGKYLLALQIPAFTTDAAPSRPWLYPVEFI